MLSLSLLNALFAIMAPTFIGTAIGWCWARKGWAFPAEFISKIVMNIGTPCLILATLSKLHLSLELMGTVALGFAGVMACCMGVGWVCVRLKGWSSACVLPSMMFPNTGNMGLPVCLFAFGETGLALAMGAFMVMLFAQYTLGLLIVAPSAGSWKAQTLQLLKHPVIMAMGLAVLLMATHTPLPAWAFNTVSLLGGFAIPLMMITLGVSLAKLQVTAWQQSLVVSLLRVLGGAALGFGIGRLLGLSHAALGVLVLQSAMPAAVMNYVMALEYQRGAQQVAAMVLLSTAISFVVLPVLLAGVM